MNKVSFDFDDTLSENGVQRFAKELVKAGYNVHIVTSRMSNQRAANPTWNDDLNFVADCVGIENVHFCNLKPKWKFFEGTDFLFHLDDDIEEVQSINNNTDVPAIHFIKTYDMRILDKCRKLI